MRSTDLPALCAIADLVHPDHPESPEALASRLTRFPAGCFLAEGTPGIFGYCLSHPGHVGRPPPLDSVLSELPADADCLYLHDLALVPAARGRGLGEAMVGMLAAVARAHGFDRIALTAVNRSWGFWERQGFCRIACPALASYGEAAVYMVKRIEPTVDHLSNMAYHDS